MPVVCDRYVASTYAYHTGMGLDPEYAMQKVGDERILVKVLEITLRSIFLKEHLGLA